MRRSKGFLKDIILILEQGGWVRFTHHSCHPELFCPSGALSVSLDGRSYHAFLDDKKLQATLVKSRAGSLENNNLVIEWRKIR